MPYYSQFYGIEVRDEIAAEFREPDGSIDDMMAGLHEIRARLAEQKYDLVELERRQQEKGTVDPQDFAECQRPLTA